MTTLKDWLGTFWRILLSPIPGTFEAESKKAPNKLGSAIGWAVFLSFYSYLLPLLKGSTFDFSVLVFVLLVFPLLVLLVPSVCHFAVRRIFRKKQYIYDKVLYIFTSIVVLYQLISAPISYFVPPAISSVLGYLVLAYACILFVIALKVIAGIEYGQALITTILAVIAGGLIFFCTLPFIMSLMSGANSTLR